MTLVVRRTAIFPDAPTDRGRRHLLALLGAHRRGWGAAVVFVVQRNDARRFSPNWRTDPKFAKTLVQVAQAGVLVLAPQPRDGVLRTTVEKLVGRAPGAAERVKSIRERLARYYGQAGPMPR